MKRFKCKVNPAKGLLVKYSTFSGSVQIRSILDAKGRDIGENKGDFSPLERSYSEMEYQIPPIFFESNKQTYDINESVIIVIEGVKESTFLLEYYEL